jgi:hypothetical protein
MRLEKIKEFCPMVQDECIRDKCFAFTTERVRPDHEYHGYLAADIYVDRVQTNIKWCKHYGRHIGCRYRVVK